MHMKSALKLAILGCALLSSAHPGHHEPLDGPDVQLYKRNVQSGLQKCSTEYQNNGLQARVESRRKAMIALHRRHLRIRDTDTVLNKSHQATHSMSPSMSEKEIFNSPEKVCLLGPSPEGETGPYWLPGERVRSHIREGQAGVPVVIQQQYIDVETCKPVPDLYAEIWGCNATGVYSGLVADGNGNSADQSNHNRTFLRGIQKTDSDGVVMFDTLFPGHYDSRTTHYHNIAHFHAKRLANNTIAGGKVSHIGQIFWDQDIISAVESTYPYNTNSIPITPNAEDRVVNVETENSEADPMLNYAYLGDSVEDGLFAWITVAVNLSAVHYPYYTNVYAENGGMAVDGTSDGSPRDIDGGLPRASSVPS
ncbi:Intradiol ring-cleavage dioxygenase, core [Penicillium camemberti]|uniref:Intradiol ring-cleavage dioxygenase, core n=1 Tax=Penicillium camemberti (strain FM 013) TaxID=1429867 RepID=A0A0G4PM83_PENC3|nr:Intradiol ring-cleavage dioxygenase, core [Penicillium camemberti]